MPPRAAPIRILLVDDHAMVRRGMRDFLALHDDLEIVGEAADGAAAIEQAAALKPDVVVMDLLMPGVDGIDATARIKAADPDIEIVAITSFIEEARIVAALEAGASGFLLKDAEADELAAAIRAAAAGEVHLDPAVAGIVARRMRNRAAGATGTGVGSDGDALGGLTARERDVLGARRAWALESGDRGRARHHGADRADARVEHPGQARPGEPDAGRPARGPARPGSRHVREAAYDIDGPADGPPIVFVHGTRLTRSMWRAQMDDLRDAYRVIAVDLPGHGRLADRRFTLASAADAVADVDRDGRRWARGRRRPVAGWVRRDGPGGSPSGARSRPCPVRRDRRTRGRDRDAVSGPRLGHGSVRRAGGSMRSMRGSSGPASHRRIVRADHRGRLLVGRRRASPPSHRRRALPAASRRVPRLRPSSSTASGTRSSAWAPEASRAPPRMLAGCGCEAPPTSPTSTDRGRSASPSVASWSPSRRPIQRPANPASTGAKRVRC